jgi:ribosomal protein S26
VLAALEKTVAVVGILVTEGLPGLWKWVLEKVGDIKEMVLGQIKDFVVDKIVKAGLTWIISLLNPAAAFIKACKAIYDIVMFFVDKAAQIKEFVDTVLDSIESIAKGGVGAVAGLIEKALAKAVPLVLGMLASLLGLGGISEKIKNIIEKVSAPVNKVIDSVVGTVVKAGKGFLAKFKKDGRSPAERKAALDAAMAEGQTVLHLRDVTNNGIRSRLAAIKNVHKVKKLDLVVDAKTPQLERVHVVGANSPTIHGPAVTRVIAAVQRSTTPPVTATSPIVSITQPSAGKLLELLTMLDSPLLRPGKNADNALIALTQQRFLTVDQTPNGVVITEKDVVGTNPPHPYERRAMQERMAMEKAAGKPVECHHCGRLVPRASGNWTVDHIPPSRLIQEIPKDLLKKAGVYDPTIATREYPHCASCQGKQGNLVMHAIKLYHEIKAAGGI